MNKMIQKIFSDPDAPFKGGFKSEDTEKIFIAKINIPNHYPEQKIRISCLKQ